MKISRWIVALATLVVLLGPQIVPTAAYADSDSDRCSSSQRGDDCKENRKAGFQTKFFGG